MFTIIAYKNNVKQTFSMYEDEYNFAGIVRILMNLGYDWLTIRDQNNNTVFDGKI